MINPIIKHNQYNKLVDEICYIGNNAILKMNVTLNRTSENYGRQSYHKEFEYKDQKSGEFVINMKRSFDYFLSIENLKPVDNIKEYIIIGVGEVMLVRSALNAATKWFNSKEFDGLYYKKQGKLYTKKVAPIEINELPGGKYIILEPTIVEYGAEQSPGIKIYLSSSANYSLMNVHRFMAVVQSFNDINMYMAAQMMLAYFGRPDYGTNLTSFGKDEDALDNGGISGRVVPAARKISFFDKFD